MSEPTAERFGPSTDQVRQILARQTAIKYCFSEVAALALFREGQGARWSVAKSGTELSACKYTTCEKRRNETGLKSLKTNNPEKSVIRRLQ
jgi:hypothetical protein